MSGVASLFDSLTQGTQGWARYGTPTANAEEVAS